MHKRADDGQTTAELLGVLVVVVALVTALVAGHPGRLIGSGVRAKVCEIAQHPCGGLDAAAPKKHHGGGIAGFLGGAVHSVGSAFGTAGGVIGDVSVGVYEGVRDPVVLGYKLSPFRAQVDPEGFAKDARTFVGGLAHGVTHPAELGKAVIDWDTWAHDPARAVGHLIPNIAFTIATAAAGKAALTGEELLAAQARAAAQRDLLAAAETEARTAAEQAAEKAGTRVAEIADAAGSGRSVSSLISYADGLEEDLARKFVPGSASFHTGPLDEDLYVAQLFDRNVALGERSLRWWTTPEEMAGLRSVDEAQQTLALLPEWGDRNAVAIARIPKGTTVEFLYGRAATQVSATGASYLGGGTQFRFLEFDPRWVMYTRPFP